jgi:hypothetical protein
VQVMPSYFHLQSCSESVVAMSLGSIQGSLGFAPPGKVAGSLRAGGGINKSRGVLHFCSQSALTTAASFPLYLT